MREGTLEGHKMIENFHSNTYPPFTLVEKKGKEGKDSETIPPFSSIIILLNLSVKLNFACNIMEPNLTLKCFKLFLLFKYILLIFFIFLTNKVSEHLSFPQEKQ